MLPQLTWLLGAGVFDDPAAWSREFAYDRLAPRQKSLFKEAQALLGNHGLNLCFNRQIPEAYDPDLDNILIAIESPAFVRDGYEQEDQGWIRDGMEFVAEISWENYTGCPLHHIPRTLYTTHDGWVAMHPTKAYPKSKGTSFTFSERAYTEGHRFRQAVGDRFAEDLDLYGSGVGTWLEDKILSLADHRFHVAVENCNHDHYATEKIFDPLKTLTIPLYRGGTRTLEALGFDMAGILTFDTLDELEALLDRASPELYEELLPAARANRARLVEIRNQAKLEYYLSISVQTGYMHAPASYGRSAKDGSLAKILKDNLPPSYPEGLNLAPETPEDLEASETAARATASSKATGGQEDTDGAK